MRLNLHIPGKPFAKQRPQFSRKSGRAFTPKETVSFENTVATLAAQRIKRPLTGPVLLRVVAVFAVPKSRTKREKRDMPGLPHTQRPDLDNIVKAVSDGLNRIAYADDNQIATLHAQKRWGEADGTFVTVEELQKKPGENNGH